MFELSPALQIKMRWIFLMMLRLLCAFTFVECAPFIGETSLKEIKPDYLKTLNQEIRTTTEASIPKTIEKRFAEDQSSYVVEELAIRRRVPKRKRCFAGLMICYRASPKRPNSSNRQPKGDSNRAINSTKRIQNMKPKALTMVQKLGRKIKR